MAQFDEKMKQEDHTLVENWVNTEKNQDERLNNFFGIRAKSFKIEDLPKLKDDIYVTDKFEKKRLFIKSSPRTLKLIPSSEESQESDSPILTSPRTNSKKSNSS